MNTRRTRRSRRGDVDVPQTGRFENLSERVSNRADNTATHQEQTEGLTRGEGALRRAALGQGVADAACELANAEYAEIRILGTDGDGEEISASAGIDPATTGRIDVLAAVKGILGDVIVARRPLRLRDLRDHPASAPFLEHRPQRASFLGVPIVVPEIPRGSDVLSQPGAPRPIRPPPKVLGGLCLLNKRGAPEFSPEDEDLIVALARHAALAIETAWLQSRDRQEVESLHQVLSTVCHDLANPLTVVMGLATTMAEHHGDFTKEQFTAVLDRIVDQSVRIDRMLRDLIDLCRIEAGPHGVLPAVRVATAAERALSFAPPPPTTSIELAIPEDVVVRADSNLLERILINLLTNAYKYGGARVRIEASRTQDGVVTAVSDDGEGVPLELVPHLFERFKRGPNVGGAPGSGLGLAIVSRLLEQMGGHLSYEAAKPAGARFSVWLLADDQGIADRRAASPPLPAVSFVQEAELRREPQTGVTTILIVDDEPDVLFLLRMTFEVAGYRVVEARHGAAALERLTDSSPDLVVTDLMMPVMDGRELIQRLRSEPQTATIPILLIGTWPDISAGADAVIRKPFRLAELLDSVASLLRSGD
jgi:CheY-like chemotaxis protein